MRVIMEEGEIKISTRRQHVRVTETGRKKYKKRSTSRRRRRKGGRRGGKGEGMQTYLGRMIKRSTRRQKVCDWNRK